MDRRRTGPQTTKSKLDYVCSNCINSNTNSSVDGSTLISCTSVGIVQPLIAYTIFVVDIVGNGNVYMHRYYFSSHFTRESGSFRQKGGSVVEKKTCCIVYFCMIQCRLVLSYTVISLPMTVRRMKVCIKVS